MSHKGIEFDLVLKEKWYRPDENLNIFWIDYNAYKLEKEHYERLKKRWWNTYLYGKEDGLDTIQYPIIEEQQSGDKQGRVPLKDSGKVPKRNGYSTLLCIKEGGDLLQDKTMRVSGKRAQGIGPSLWAIEDRVSAKIWNTLRKANKI